VGEGHLSWK